MHKESWEEERGYFIIQMERISFDMKERGSWMYKKIKNLRER